LTAGRYEPEKYDQALFEFFIAVIFSCLLDIIFLLPLVSYGKPLERHRYRQQTGDMVEYFDWLLEKPGDFHLAAISEKETHRTILDDQLRTQRWTLESPTERTSIEARREGNNILLNGRRQGQPKQEQLEIDAAPWYQALSLSLRAFLASSQDRMKFWTLRPDELKLLKLRVVKKGLETLWLDGRPTEAQRLELRLTGLASLLGYSLYWFRTGDGLFLKYQGPNGMPGLKTTTITLDRELTAATARLSAPPILHP